MSAAFVTNFLKEKHLLDAAGAPLHALSRRFLADQRLARTLMGRGVEARAYVAQHLRERARLQRERSARAARGEPAPEPPEHYPHDERWARHLASLGLCGGDYLAAHAAERAALDAAGVPEGERGDTYRRDAKMVAELEGRRRLAAARAAPAQQQLLLLQGSLLVQQRPSAPVSPLSHWVGAELPLASWRERILGRAELTLRTGSSTAGAAVPSVHAASNLHPSLPPCAPVQAQCCHLRARSIAVRAREGECGPGGICGVPGGLPLQIRGGPHRHQGPPVERSDAAGGAAVALALAAGKGPTPSPVVRREGESDLG